MIGEHKFSIRKLNEWSLLHNSAVKVLNKPKRVVVGCTGFELTNLDRWRII